MTITTLGELDEIVLSIPDTDCYEEVSGWEVLFFNNAGPYEYCVTLDEDGTATICWAADPSLITIYLTDATEIAGTTWAEFKEEALETDFKDGFTYVSKTVYAYLLSSDSFIKNLL